MTDKTRKSDSGGRVLRVMKALKGHSLVGLSNGELAKALGESPATINRCVNTLIAEGMAVRLDTGRFALSVAALQIAQAHATEMSRASDRLNELTQRVAAGSY
ncbi:helix-turn-helix domain-containing protein [Nitrincola iocasae]|uniref:Helix-turn-helix domain-containing protein n=1 Tax=Nitrincola iocasae TaxID=2614693 RepID=A0A5J6LAT0_9GAMM|nr:helix-turn-helix domain-containing protein [Nitrincola iocasae]QEW05627.1 helix-turn-helix domain-containing protein [Nitrincola iocasae]